MLKMLFKTILILIFAGTIILPQEKKPNFIIFIADDVSWDDLGCYGNKNVQTPNIDKLASNGIKFNNVYLTASSCSPSRNSIMTGRYPHNSGAAELHTQPPVEMKSFPELLRNNGYFTAQGGKFHMGEYAKRGFDIMYTSMDDVGNGGENSWIRTVKERPKEKPFFMWFAAYDAHRDWGENSFTGTHKADEIEVPFYLADAEATKNDLAKYYDEIKRFDYFIGEVVKELDNQKALENTFIIVMADNGRPFPHSKTRVNDRGMKTPFVLNWPSEVNKNSVCESLVSVIDIAPTILELAGIEVIDQFQGESFSKIIKSPESKFRNYVFAEHNWHDYEAHERMVRNEQYMYIRNARPLEPLLGPADAVSSPSYQDLKILEASGNLSSIQAEIFQVPRAKEEIYDLEKDPLQLINTASHPDYHEALKTMSEVLDKWIIDTGDDVPKNITHDWYLKQPGYIKTMYNGVRGDMPGKKSEAVKNNNKGPF